MGWADLVAAYLQWDAANKAKDKKPNYSISPQMQWLFDKMKDMTNYSPTRDYISTYSDSFLKTMNSPDGALNWKPTFQSDYMKGQAPLPSMGIDMTKAPIFQGDKNGKMPWNFGYTGPGLGGKPTTPGGTGTSPTGPAGNPIGGRGMNWGGGKNDSMGPMGGDWSSDYYQNQYNTPFGFDPDSDDYTRANGGGPRDPYGIVIGQLNDPNFTWDKVVTKNNDGSVVVRMPGMPVPSVLSPDEWAKLQANDARLREYIAKNAQQVWKYARENKMGIVKAALMLLGL